MRKIILSLAVSFDGFIEGPNKEIDWLSFTPETGEVLNKFLQEIDTVLYGRVSYEAWGTYQPAADAADFEKNFYSKLNSFAHCLPGHFGEVHIPAFHLNGGIAAC